MSERASEIDGVAVAESATTLPEGDIEEDGGDVAYVITNDMLLETIRKTRQIARDLRHRSIDDHDPTLALRAHEVQAIGETVLERLLITQGGQEMLDELNTREHAANQSGTTTVWPR